MQAPNQSKTLLAAAGNGCPICDSAQIERRPEQLRDSDAVGVLECKNCKHLFLDDFSHVHESYYVAGAILEEKPFAATIEDRQRHYRQENLERVARISPLIANKRVLDFGCGHGQLLEMAAPLCKSIEGVEPTQAFRDHLASSGTTVWPVLDDCAGPFDVIYSFHVLEHLPDPVGALRALSERLAEGGVIYVEVPNVNDALIALYDNEAATRFHFFLNHLHYFSRASLGTAIRQSGLRAEAITGHQRFSLANHVHWLSRDKPGGHVTWSFLDDAELVAHYGRVLAANDLCDSLIAQIRAVP